MSQSRIPYTVVVPTGFGMMLLNRNDINQTEVLFKTGHAIDHGDIALLARILAKIPGYKTVIDGGANFGTYSLALGHMLGDSGEVHAFEPQRLICNMIAGSVALNCLSNVYVRYEALGADRREIDLPKFDYYSPMNFGSVEFCESQNEPLEQQRGPSTEKVQQVDLDSYTRDLKNITLIKLDVEGMEEDVLAGANQTIDKWRPILFIEHAKCDRGKVRQWLQDRRYRVSSSLMDFLAVPEEKASQFESEIVAFGV